MSIWLSQRTLQDNNELENKICYLFLSFFRVDQAQNKKALNMLSESWLSNWSSGLVICQLTWIVPKESNFI